MLRIFIISLFLSAGQIAFAQLDSLSKEDLRMLDSMFKNDEFVKLMMSQQKRKSYFDVNFGVGNQLFSLKNNAFNAGQTQTNKTYYTPAVAYNHKSGIGIMVNGSVASDDDKLKVYQYVISPSYTYNNKKFVAGISYSRYIEGEATGFVVNPFSHDFYASGLYKRTWIQPGIALGYSFGKVLDYYDTTITFIPSGSTDPRTVRIQDTISTRLSSFSVTVSASHTFSFWKFLHKKDALQLQPTIMLNAGSQKWNVTHSNSLFDRRPFIQNYFKRRFGDGQTTLKFNLQSAGVLTGLTYYYGKFYLQPQLYLDYYLLETFEKRLTSLFSVTAGFAFY